jgi:hypothetical protein
VEQFREEREADQLDNQRGEKYPDGSERFYIQQKSGSVELSTSVNRWLASLALEGGIPEVVEVLRRMLDANPDKRPSARIAFASFDEAIRRTSAPPSPQYYSNNSRLPAC